MMPDIRTRQVSDKAQTNSTPSPSRIAKASASAVMQAAGGMFPSGTGRIRMIDRIRHRRPESRDAHPWLRA
jgi:hypothetical protein